VPPEGTLLSVEGSLVGIESQSTRQGTAALFTQTSFYSNRVFVPLNGCALNADLDLPCFYCVHSVSGTAGTDFLELAAKLEPHVKFYGIQAPPALMSKIEFGGSIESIATYYADALNEFQPKGVLNIGGYCVGAVIALAMVNHLLEKGREIGPLVAIDGVPENTPFALARWKPRYWAEFAHNAYLRIRGRSIGSVAKSIFGNLSAIAKNMLSGDRTEKFGAGYSIESVIDLSRFPPVHVSFIKRLFSAIFEYTVSDFSGDVVVYEASVKRTMLLPQIGRIWRKLAPRAEVVALTGTHHRILREPCVDTLAADLLERIKKAGHSQPSAPPP
jgi:thioesterase domain-containing protein